MLQNLFGVLKHGNATSNQLVCKKVLELQDYCHYSESRTCLIICCVKHSVKCCISKPQETLAILSSVLMLLLNKHAQKI